MTRKTLLSLLGAAGMVALATACSTHTTLLGSEVTPGGDCTEEGDTQPADDGCNTCTCSTDGTWACTEMDCGEECTEGDSRPAGDDCNTCGCVDGQWACTLMACPPTGCTEGDTEPADDCCNTCTCSADGTWACTDMACTGCLAGDTQPAPDACNTCSCDADGNWVCTQRACACVDGETQPAGDGCNTCSCVGGTWACTLRACTECTPGDTQLEPDGCNECFCTTGGTWACTDMACTECTPGDTRIAADGCNTETCTADGVWGPPTEIACPTCTDGDTMPAGDDCNTCSCVDGNWLCTLMACPECTDGETKTDADGCNECFCTGGTWACTDRACVPECPAPTVAGPSLVGCIAVVVYAKDPATGMCCEYGDPCTAPADWPQFYSMDECNGAPICPAPLPSTGCNDIAAWAKDPVTGLCCNYGVECTAPVDWDHYGDQASCEAAPSGVFTCGDTTRCTTGEEYCMEVSGGPAGSPTTYECVAFEADCASCDCLGTDATIGCECRDSAGTTLLSCAMP